MRRAGLVILGATAAGWLALLVIDSYLAARRESLPRYVHGDLCGLLLTASATGLIMLSTATLRDAVRELTRRVMTAKEAYTAGRHRRRFDDGGDSRELRLVR